MALSFGVTVLPDPPYSALARADPARRAARLRVRLDVRLARPLAGVVPAAHARRAGDDDDEARALRDEPRRRASRRCSRARTRRSTTSPTAGWSWASAAATRRVRYIGRQAGEGRRVRAALRDDQGVHERPRGRRGTRSSSSSRGCARSCPRSRCGSPATGRRRSPSPVASATASSSSSPTRRSSSGSWTRPARPPRRRAATRRRSSASSARRATSPTTSPTRASRCAGSRRWSRTTSRT